jgi:hypothetical protein
VGDGSRGLLRRRRGLDRLHARPGAKPRLPVGRGRPPRHHRPGMPAVLRPRLVEREGPHPQGAALRPLQRRGEPRRGREGALPLPRLDAYPLLPRCALPLPPGGVPLPAPGGGGRRAGARPPGVRDRGHRGLPGRPFLRRPGRIRQGFPRRHPRQHRRLQPRAPPGAAPPPADALVPQHLVLGTGGGGMGRARASRPSAAGSSPTTSRWGASGWPRLRGRAASGPRSSSPRTRRTRGASSGRGTRPPT